MEYSKSPFYDEVQALMVSCEVEREVQAITTNASVVAEVQLLHLKMDDDFSTEYPNATVHEVQARPRLTPFASWEVPFAYSTVTGLRPVSTRDRTEHAATLGRPPYSTIELTSLPGCQRRCVFWHAIVFLT